MDRYDEEAAQRSAAVAEVAARLRSRGITVTGAERPEDLADLLSAVERFEAACARRGTTSPCGPTSAASTRQRRSCAAIRGSPTDRRS